VDELIDERLGQLRRLQEEEAAAIESHFSRTLSVPIGFSEILLEKAQALVNRHANSSRTDQTRDASDREAP
jgi:hypothetical protein